ncbi:MAG TPA: 4-alpha-glucanotransferase [candidate division WOR-3 bacterium]|uniref:4-alpha-glucanotransferase n=1 Tax=candidate division WOR-3 bacterium TaxID=2052148 RepID=A0A7V0T5Q4_UNCW3|nr:4-alpha-glucanotransferase [candidate division WOR-3 bacterium]
MRRGRHSLPRAAGVLLHVSSLPGPHGIGDFGPAARGFADWLARAGFRWWQVLPLNPTDPFYGSSPYRSISSNALSPLFTSPKALVADRRLGPEEARPPRLPAGRVDHQAAGRWKARLLDRAAARAGPDDDFARFLDRERGWLSDFALFAALKRRFKGVAWTDWPEKLRDRDPAALERARKELAAAVRREEFVQYFLDRQWRELRAHCRRLGVGIIGDLPMYPDHDSADVWAARRYFKLDRQGRPRFAAGVPPDYFSKTGQLWGNPVYDWRALVLDGFGWWLDRCARALRLFDAVRLDHFRGLVAGWQVPTGARTAEHGRWVRAPGAKLMAALRERFPELPFIAEDLGHITPAVERARRSVGLPGMKVAVFGFGTDRSPHRPDRVPADAVLYSSTHDTNTVRGWFEQEAGPEERRRLARVLSRPFSAPLCVSVVSPPVRTLLEACLASPAGLVIIAAQDLLGLGARARMNTPGTTSGNWRWRLPADGLTDVLAADLRRSLADADRVSRR